MWLDAGGFTDGKWKIFDRYMTPEEQISKPLIAALKLWDSYDHGYGAYGKEGDKYWVNQDSTLDVLYVDTEEEAKSLLAVILRLS